MIERIIRWNFVASTIFFLFRILSFLIDALPEDTILGSISNAVYSSHLRVFILGNLPILGFAVGVICLAMVLWRKRAGKQPVQYRAVYLAMPFIYFFLDAASIVWGLITYEP